MPEAFPSSGNQPAFRYALANSLDSVEEGRLRLVAFLAPLGVSDRQLNRIEVVFEELVSNIVRYGTVCDESGRIVIGVRTVDDALEITFEDNGLPFNPLHKEAPAPFDTLENARIGGLGIPLLRKFTQAVRYEYADDVAEFADLAAVDVKGGLNRVITRFAKA